MYTNTEENICIILKANAKSQIKYFLKMKSVFNASELSLNNETFKCRKPYIKVMSTAIKETELKN